MAYGNGIAGHRDTNSKQSYQREYVLDKFARQMQYPKEGDASEYGVIIQMLVCELEKTASHLCKISYIYKAKRTN